MNYFIHDFDPIAFELFGMPFPWYWLVYFFGYFFVLFQGRKLVSIDAIKVSFQNYQSYLFYGFIVMITSAKIFYIFAYHPSFYFSNPEKIFHFWEGGMSFHGALLGITLWTLFFAKKTKISPWRYSDLLVTSVPLVLFLGRLANFINGELAGRVTRVPWGVIFPKLYDYNVRHPSQLYQAILEGLILYCILQYSKKDLKDLGRQTVRFLFFYGLFRFFSEYFREPDSQIGYIIGLSVGQLYCLAMMLISFIIFVRRV